MTPTFASTWLIPRLPLFRSRHPDITVNLSIRNGRFLFEESSFDAAIHFSAAQWTCRRSLPGQLAYYVAHTAERPGDTRASALPGLAG